MRAADRTRSACTSLQRGIALLSTLWIVSLLAVLATGMMAATRDETRFFSSLLAQAEARHMAEGALQLAMHALLYPDPAADRWPTDGTEFDLAIGHTTSRVSICDEAGRIDLNLVQPDLLTSLLAVAGVAEDRREQLVDAILDWRDGDPDARVHGAEDEAYAGAGLRYGAKDAEFESVAELRRVLGMPPDLYATLQPALTVYSGRAGINPSVAPRLVLLALANGNEAAVDAYLHMRAQDRDGRLNPIRPSFVDRRLSSAARGLTYTISARVTRSDGVTGQAQATMTLARGNPDQPLQILAWRTGLPSAGEPAELAN